MITGIGHSAFRTSDLNRALGYYMKLGLHEVFRLHREDGSIWLVYVRIRDGQYLELFPGATEPVALSRQTIGYGHLCLLVDDLEKTVSDIEREGVTIDQAIKMGADGNLQAWIVDPDGNRIELMQIMPESLQSKSEAGAV